MQDLLVRPEAVLVPLRGRDPARAGADDHAVVLLAACPATRRVDAGAALGGVDLRRLRGGGPSILIVRSITWSRLAGVRVAEASAGSSRGGSGAVGQRAPRAIASAPVRPGNGRRGGEPGRADRGAVEEVAARDPVLLLPPLALVPVAHPASSVLRLGMTDHTTPADTVSTVHGYKLGRAASPDGRQPPAMTALSWSNESRRVSASERSPGSASHRSNATRKAATPVWAARLAVGSSTPRRAQSVRERGRPPGELDQLALLQLGVRGDDRLAAAGEVAVLAEHLGDRAERFGHGVERRGRGGRGGERGRPAARSSASEPANSTSRLSAK